MTQGHNKRRTPPAMNHALHLKFIFIAMAVLLLMLGIGVLGYHFLGDLSWIDSLLEAAMILGGMGAIAPMTNDAVKLFASGYALFSGFVALGTMAVILAPLIHHLLRYLHIDPEDDDGQKKS